MPLELTNYPVPGSKAAKYSTAYSWLPGIYLDRSPGSGGARLVLTVHPSEGDWREAPIGQVEVRLGEVARPAVAADPDATPPVEAMPEVRFASLNELLAETTPVGNTGVTFAQAFAVLGLRLYQESLKHSACEGGSLIP